MAEQGAVAEQYVVQEVDLETKIRSELQTEYQNRLEAQVKEITQKMSEENQKVVSEAIERFRKEMTPPSQQDIKMLVEQEYVEVEFEVQVGRKAGAKKRKFVIRELPQSVERKMFKKVKEKLVPLSTELAGLSLNLMDGDMAKKLVQVMNTFDPMLEVMTSVCTLCLNPFGEEEDVDEQWVSENLSSTRIVKVVTAQAQCNKLRDFFSLLFQGTKAIL
jgi:hypothetical protein